MSAKARFWLLTFATLLGMAVTASLGRWQLGRAAEKETLQAAIEAQARLPVLDAVSAAAPEAAPEMLHRRALARGVWVAERTVFLDNRQMNGRPGFFVVTPLRLEGQAGVLLVQRGWVPRDFEDRARVPAVVTPPGLVEIQGRLTLPPSKLYEMGTVGQGLIRQNLDLASYRLETGLPLAGLTLQQTAGADDGLQRDWPQINTGVDKHYGYAFQWFGLCALMAILYVWFQIVRRLRSRSS